jgi:NTE family protein
MADLDRGRVLAVDVAGEAAFQHPARRGWRARLLRRLAGVPDAVPGIAELLLRAATAAGDAQTNLSLARADRVIRPPLAGVDLRAWRATRRSSRSATGTPGP